MQSAEFDFDLPKGLIAQVPALQRDLSRMLVLHRSSGKIEHRGFRDLIPYLHKGDVLVLNDSRVIRARLHGQDVGTGREFEILLLEQNAINDWWTMMRPGKYARPGTQIRLRDHRSKQTQVTLTVQETNADGHRRSNFSGTANVLKILDELGEVPLPPYISRSENNQSERDDERYQTTFAKNEGSVAAPTAGLHFTEAVLDEIRSRGVKVCFLTLHVGVATFAPVKSEDIADHRMHEERFEITEQTARLINESKRAGHRIVAVGTTTVRVLESLAVESVDHTVASLREKSCAGRTRIFIYPPSKFKIVDALLTNFHLPRSTLLMLVSAFAAPEKTTGRELILKAYAEAIHERYRFFSYGDAMLIL